MSRPQGYIEGEAPASQHRSGSNGGSKVRSERVALLVVSALLAAAVIVICRLSLDNMHTKQSFQTLREEHEAVKRNLTDDPCPKCEYGWEQDGRQCYYFSINRSTWSESRDECRQKGGDLVQIDSREEQTFLELKLREKMNFDEDKFWIGLTDSEKEGTWLWVDGSLLNERFDCYKYIFCQFRNSKSSVLLNQFSCSLTLSLTFWNGSEPDNWTERDPDGEDCVRMGEKPGAPDLNCWFDEPCKVPHRSICEKPAETGHFTLQCVGNVV
uniref:C-type lectin domain-containing protein n=1 Tax=Dicentrarchus labrax TaxID=13489 RepID=A0A8P4G5L2_DICLA